MKEKMFSVGDFAIFRGLPVSIKSINDDDVEIKYCLDLSDEDDDDDDKDFLRGFQTKVKLSNLLPLNKDSAKDLLNRYNSQISKLNVIIHGVNDCLNRIIEYDTIIRCPLCKVPVESKNMYCCSKCGWDAYV